MAEWSNAAVLKTVEGHTSGGSNPSSSAKNPQQMLRVFVFNDIIENQPITELFLLIGYIIGFKRTTNLFGAI